MRAQPGMVRRSLPLAEAQEFTQRQTVGTAPFEATFAVDTFKVADQQHAKVAARRQRWATTARRIFRGTLRLDESVEVRRDQHRLQLVVESVTRRAGHLRPCHQHVRLPFPLPSKRHPPPAFLVGSHVNQTVADFVNGLLRVPVGGAMVARCHDERAGRVEAPRGRMSFVACQLLDALSPSNSPDASRRPCAYPAAGRNPLHQGEHRVDCHGIPCACQADTVTVR